MPPADNMPDFDSMSPEEIMTWMESLALRQGATEGLTTAADMDIAELDPTTAVVTGPGYVPYEDPDAKRRAAAAPAPAESARPQPPAAPPAAAPAAAESVRPQPPAAPPAAAPAPAESARPQPPAAPPVTAPPAVSPIRPMTAPPRPVINTAPPAYAQMDDPNDADIGFEVATVQTSAVETDGLAWLEQLAAGQDDSLFNLDLSSLENGSAFDELDDDSADDMGQSGDPASWLEELARNQEDTFDLSAFSFEAEGEAADSAEPASAPRHVVDTGVVGDPLTWLESLALRQGADPDELITEADLDIPRVDEEETETPAYTPFTFETPQARRTSQQADPSDFLQELARSQGYDEDSLQLPSFGDGVDDSEQEMDSDMDLEAITASLRDGTVTPEEMQYWLDQQADAAISIEDEPVAPAIPTPVLAADPNAPAQPADIPDWLMEQMPEEPALFSSESPLQPQMPLEALFGAFTSEAGEDIFDDISSGMRDSDIAIDISDPWVEAFEQEQGQQEEGIPEWYSRNLHDPSRIRAIEGLGDEDESFASSELNPQPLPLEEILSQGEAQAIPTWMQLESAITEDEVPEAEGQVFDDMPEWMREIEAADNEARSATGIGLDWLGDAEAAISPEEVPDWLMETLDTMPAPVSEPPPRPAPVAVREPAREFTRESTRPATREPARSPVGSANLQVAREKLQAGDLSGGLVEYESLIRARVDVDNVVDDLERLANREKSPMVYRLLGDGLMRQGKLQAALDTYREALSQL